MQEHPNGDITAPGFRWSGGQLTLSNAILIAPRIGTVDTNGPDWTHAKSGGKGWMENRNTGERREYHMIERKPSIKNKIRAALRRFILD